jgi:hypothetical protein
MLGKLLSDALPYSVCRGSAPGWKLIPALQLREGGVITGARITPPEPETASVVTDSFGSNFLIL